MTTLTNGLIPDALLIVADGTQRLRAGTASRWAWVCQQVQRRYGWTPRIVSGGGYRSLQQQVAIFTARYVPSATGAGPFGDVRWWNGVRYIRTSSAGAAAVPGTSNHGLGTAVDVDGLTVFGTTQRAQFAAVASAVGFSDAEGRAVGEPWHWVDTASPDVATVATTTGTGGAVLSAPGPMTAEPPPEDDMSAAGEAAILAALTNIEGILARDGGDGIRGDVLTLGQHIDATRADVGTVANELRAGLVALGQQIAADQAPTAAQIAPAIPAGMARDVAAELAKLAAKGLAS